MRKTRIVTTENRTADKSLTILTETEQRRVNHGVLLQALREVLHAANAGTTLAPSRTTEIQGIAADPAAKDEVLLQALRDMLEFTSGQAQLTEARVQKVFHLADCGGPIEDILCNDESSSDEELIDHLVMAFEMRRIEAVEHVKRRDYLQRYLPPAAARN